jgi:hypothetical protein
MKMHKVIFFLIFYISPFIDTITGYFLKIGIMSEAALFSPSQLFKFSLFGMSFIYYFSKCKRGEGYTYLLLFLLSLFYESLLGIIFSSKLTYVFIGYANILKIFYLLMLYLLLRKLLDGKYYTIDDLLDYIIKNGMICVFLLIFTTIIGINLTTYGEGTFGSKGLFPSGNGLGVYLGGVSLISLIKLNKMRSFNNFISSAALIIGVLLIGSKTSIIFLLIDFFFISRYILKYTSLFFIPILIIVVMKYLDFFRIIYDVILFRYERSKSLFSFFASMRDNYVVNAFNEYEINGLFAIRIFTGLGAFISFRKPSHKILPYDTLETDFFDIFFMYGAIGLFFYLAIIGIILFKAYKCRYPGVLLFSFAVLGHSLIAGHCLFNAMSGVLIVFAIILGEYKISSMPKSKII